MDSVSGLSSYFKNIISSTMVMERRPLTQLENQKKLLDTQRTDYSAVQSKIDALQNAVHALNRSHALSALRPSRQTSFSGLASGVTFATASASSLAVPGQYEITVTSLAKAQQRKSAVQNNPDVPAGHSGEFWLGGAGANQASAGAGTVLAGADPSALAEGIRELGTGEYRVEVRVVDGVKSFRLKDADGSVVAVDDLAATDNRQTTGWQALPAGGAFDTRRGLTIRFAAAPEAGEAAVSYTAAGLKVDINTSDTLVNIANKINEARQPEGHAVSASVIGSYLVLTASQTGTAHRMIYQDSAGLGFSNDLASETADLQKASDAVFSVNHIAFTRSINTGLTDVISGVTLDLAPDAAGTAYLDIKASYSNARGAIDTFLAKFNELQSFLQEKTGVKDTGGGTYSRGSLSGQSVFSDLRSNLFSAFMANSTVAGAFSSLREIGINIDETLKATVSDSGKLDAALSGSFDDVAAVLESVMTEMTTRLGSMTGSDGYLVGSLQNLSNQETSLSSSIKSMNERLTAREATLANQYAELQAQLLNLSYMQQSWASIASSVSQLV